MESGGDGDFEHLEMKRPEVGHKNQDQRVSLGSHTARSMSSTTAEVAVRNQMPAQVFLPATET